MGMGIGEGSMGEEQVTGGVITKCPRYLFYLVLFDI